MSKPATRAKLVFIGSSFEEELGIFRNFIQGPDGPPQVLLCGEKAYIARDEARRDEQGKYLVYDEAKGLERVA